EQHARLVKPRDPPAGNAPPRRTAAGPTRGCPQARRGDQPLARRARAPAAPAAPSRAPRVPRAARCSRALVVRADPKSLMRRSRAPAAARRGAADPPARPAPTATRQASATAPSQTQARTAVGAPPRPSASAPAARDPAQYLHGFVRMVQAGAGRRADQTWWSCWSTEGARAARRAGPALMLSLV